MPSQAESLTTAIAALTASTTAVNALLAQLVGVEQSAVSWSVWLDPVGGADTNDGRTPATAVATLAKAVSLTPFGSYVVVNLMRDYEMESSVSTFGRHVVIRGVTGTGSTPTTQTQRILTQTVAGGAARQLRCGDGGGFELQRLDIVLATGAISSGSAALFSGRTKQVTLVDCGVRYTDSVTTVSLVGAAGTVLLETDNVTELDDALAGHWIEGVSASTNPNTLGKVVTNLATL